MVSSTASPIAKGWKTPIRFTTATLFCATTYVAIAIVLLPIAWSVRPEIICLMSLLLCIVASICDWMPKQINWVFRGCVSLLLAISTIGMCRVVPGILHFKFSIVPTVPLALMSLLAIFPVTIARPGGIRISLSTLGFVALLGLIVWQLIQTQAQRYFVNRYITSWLTSQTLERDGAVSYNLRFQSQRSMQQQPTEIDTLVDALDVDHLYRPVTKWRLLCGCDALSSVSFSYAVAEEDWRNLRSLQEIQFVDFNSLRISSEGASSLQSLSKLRQLSCFDCELPSGFLSQLRNANQLTILQVFNCKVADLVGLGELPNLRTLNLQLTRLRGADLNQVAELRRLTELNLQDTEISNRDLVAFADCLKKSRQLRLASISCVITSSSECMEGLAALIRSGTLIELTLAGHELSEAELASLRAIDPAVTIRLLPDK